MVMINEVLNILRDKLELVLQNALLRSEKWVILANPVDQDGSIPDELNNKVVISVVSLQSDTSIGAFVPPSIGQGDRYLLSAPPLFVDVYLLVMANFSGGNYAAGIGMLSRVISFFHENPIFTPNTASGLPDEMDKLAIEFVNLDFAQANHVLMMSGLKAFPFVLYKLRRLPFAEPAISGVAPAVRSVDPPRTGFPGR